MFVAGIAFYSIKTGKSAPLIINLIIYSFIVEGFVLYKANHSFTPVFITFCLFLIFAAVCTGYIKIGHNKVLWLFGYISYSLYLVHEDVGLTIEYQLRRYTDNELIYVFCPAIFSICLAYILTKYIEMPALKSIRKIYQVSKNKSAGVS